MAAALVSPFPQRPAGPGGPGYVSAKAVLPQRIAARLTGSPWFWALLVTVLFALPIVRTLNRALPAAPPVLGSFPAFSLLDQEGRAFRSADVRGLLVVEFATSSAVASAGSPLAALQRRVRNTGGAVHLVTFLLEAPQTLPPADLAKKAGAGSFRWILASGETQAVLLGVKKSLLETIGRGDQSRRALAAPNAEVDLAGQLLLVDAHGRIRRVVGTSRDEIDLLMRDIGLLANIDR